MYRSFTIKNFRCFDELTVEGMGRINLIAGKNNVGKTALLEALWVHSGAVNPERVLRLDSFRGLSTVDSHSTVSNLFFGFDVGSTISLCAQGDWKESTRRLELSATSRSRTQLPLDLLGEPQVDDPLVSSRNQIVLEYSEDRSTTAVVKAWLSRRQGIASRGIAESIWDIDIDQDQNYSNLNLTPSILLRAYSEFSSAQSATRFSRLEIDNKEQGLLNVLQGIEPALRRLTVVATSGDPRLYADVGIGRLIPIQLLGDGMSRILSLALAIASAPEGTVLVDEIENGIHHSVMEKVWKAIGAFARSYDVQLFATTHSYECIGAAYRAFETDEKDELRLFRIQRDREGRFKAVKYDRERLGGVLELRMEFI